MLHMTNLYMTCYDITRILDIIHTKGHIYLPGNMFLIAFHILLISQLQRSYCILVRSKMPKVK